MDVSLEPLDEFVVIQPVSVPAPDQPANMRELGYAMANLYLSADGEPQLAANMQLRRMKREDITVHGFRSTFRDWASEQTSFPHETCEHALAHRISDKAEAANQDARVAVHRVGPQNLS